MSFVSFTSAESTGAISVTPTRPAGADGTNMLVALVMRGYLSGDFIVPAGWTQLVTVEDNVPTFGEIVVLRAPGDVASLTFQSTTNSGSWKAVLACFSGRGAGASDSDAANSTGSSIAVPSMDAVLGDDGIAMWCDHQDTTSLGSPPAGWTSIYDSATGDQHVAVAYRENLAAGATGALSRTCANFTSKTAAATLIPLSGGGGGGASACTVMPV
jgi:hypothetical protein